MHTLLRTPIVAIILASGSLSPKVHASGHEVLLARNRTEPTVAVDPRNPSIVVASANTNYSAPVNGTYPTEAFYSSDGGRTFGAESAPEVPPYTTGADTTVAVAHDGTVFYSYLGETPAFCSGGRSAVILAHSIDHGRSYRQPVIVDSDPNDDKPNMAVESVAGQPSHVFMTWSRIHEHTSEALVSRSFDGGRTFSRPIVLRHSVGYNFGTVPVIGIDGHVYVFWSVFPEGDMSRVLPLQFYMSRSSDDGVHFSRPRRVLGPFHGEPQMAEPGSLRTLTMPAVTAIGGGSLVLAWPQVTKSYGHGVVDTDILVSRSRTGVSWSRPVRVNDSRAGDRFMPAIAALRDGSVGIAFYDRRQGHGHLDLYAARVSWSHGAHISHNVRLNASPSWTRLVYYLSPTSTCFSPGRFFGDYIGVAARGASFCAVWADTQLGEQDETDIWYRSLRLPQVEVRAVPSSAARTGG